MSEVKHGDKSSSGVFIIVKFFFFSHTVPSILHRRPSLS